MDQQYNKSYQNSRHDEIESDQGYLHYNEDDYIDQVESIDFDQEQ